MEIGVLRDDFFVVRQIAASVGDDGIEIVDGVEVGVGKRFASRDSWLSNITASLLRRNPVRVNLPETV
jgi:hypothetical protein